MSTAQEQLFGIHWREQLELDLQLTIDWNRPDLARSEIFDKYNLDSFKVRCSKVSTVSALRAYRCPECVCHLSLLKYSQTLPYSIFCTLRVSLCLPPPPYLFLSCPSLPLCVSLPFSVCVY